MIKQDGNDSMKVMHYNIMDGCHDADKREKLMSWLQTQSCDVVSFNELNGWNQETFQTEMKALGLHHSVLFEMTTSPYFVGIASKYPVTVMNKIEEDPIYHGLLHVEIKGVHFLVPHLTPFESENRELETTFIAELIQQIDAPVIVMGDLNTLSPLDKAHYEQNQAIAYLKENPILNRQHLLEGQINYRPMEILLEAGLRDGASSDEFKHTFPTPYVKKQQKNARLRIDYMLMNDLMYDKLTGCETIHTEATSFFSDHYPVQCIYDLKKPSSNI